MTDKQKNLDFQVRKDDFHETRQVETPTPLPQPGQVVLKVHSFAVTANNITYAAFGDAMGYWQFYPAEDGWGRIPVWGYADVVASEHADIKTGERLFGYWPMAQYAVLTPAHVDAATVVEGARQRQQLNPFYNRYQRCGADPDYVETQEDWNSIFRPLGLTAFLLDEHLAEQEFWGATNVVLSSASSKTSYSLAHFLQQRDGCEVTGLTSPSNVEFVRKLDCYDQVVDYAELETLAADAPTVFVDMAGDAEVRQRLHAHYGRALKQSITVGGTHWTAIAPPMGLAGPEPTFFFAPSHIGERIKQWGPDEFQKRFASAWTILLPKVKAGIQLVQINGMEGLEDVYRAMLDGTAAANKGYIINP